MWWISMAAAAAAIVFDSVFLLGLAWGAFIGWVSQTEIAKAFWRGLTGRK